MASCLGCSLVVGAVRDCHRSLLSLYFLTVSLQSSKPWQKQLPCHLHSTEPQIMDLYMFSGASTCHRPQTPILTPGCSWTTDLDFTDFNMVSGGCTGYSQQHGSMKAQFMEIHMAINGNSGQHHQHSSQLLQDHGHSHEPPVSTWPQWSMSTKVAARGRTDIRDLSRRSNQKRNHSSSWTSCSCSTPGLSQGWQHVWRLSQSPSPRLWLTTPRAYSAMTRFPILHSPLSHGCVFIQGAGGTVGSVVMGSSPTF